MVERLGGVPDEQIAEVFKSQGLPTEAGASLLTRFSRAIARLVCMREAAEESGCFSVFLMSEALVADASVVAKKDEVPLLRNGADGVSDCIWLSDFKLSTAYRLDLDWSNQGELFGAVRDAKLGSLPAIVVDWRGHLPVAQLYVGGLGNTESIQEMYIEELPISKARMRQELDRFYQKVLRHPALIVEANGKRIWKEAGKGVPEHRPEEAIQGRLVDFLKASFALHDLRGEAVTDDGRADVKIWKRVHSKSGMPANRTDWILELKALCSKTTTGNSVSPSRAKDAVTDGLQKAMGYRESDNALNAAVCCYDMRMDDEGDEALFVHAQDEADEAGIPLWRWYLHRSTTSSRRARSYVSTF